jgi:L-aspartate oxidase
VRIGLPPTRCSRAWCSATALCAAPPDEGVIVKQNWDEIRHLMWNYVGIVRTDKRLARAQHRLDNLAEEIQEYYWGYLVTRDVIELRNLADVARLIVTCAQQRKESRGLHSTLSWPDGEDASSAHDTVLLRGKPAPDAWPRAQPPTGPGPSS